MAATAAPPETPPRAAGDERGRPGGPAPLRALASAPVTVPLLAAAALLVAGLVRDLSFPLVDWAPGALALLALLALCLLVIPPRARALPRTVLVAVAALALFTAWSGASILWADDRGTAWEGAARTVLYLVAFALPALWAQRGATAALVLGAWTLGIVGFALVTVLGLPDVDVREAFYVDRLGRPSGYANAAAAAWLLAAWPALALAAARGVPALLRGAFAGGVVLLCALALLALSRGALLAVPVVLALWFVLLPERVRRGVVLLPVAAGIALCVPDLLEVGERVEGAGARAALQAASDTTLLVALVVAVVVALGALVDGRVRVAPDVGRRVHRGLGAVGLAAVVIGLGVGIAAVGDPADRVSDAWSSFVDDEGYTEETTGSERLTTGLGSGRADYYRVGLDAFEADPLTGAGADNFAQDYLAERRTDENPTYPHSIGVRTLSQTGLVGTVLLLTAFAAAALAATRAARGHDVLARLVVAGAVGPALYWLVHGSVDWLWEFSGLGASAFFLLGLACSLQPRRAVAAPAPRQRPLTRWAARGGVVLAALATAAALALPWLAARDAELAVDRWRTDPAGAYERLDRAAGLNPLSDRALVLEASIALRRGELGRADAAFAEALERNPRGWYAVLERGAIASARGQRARAVALLRTARARNPRDPLTRDVLARARAGRRVDVAALNAAFVAGARELAAPER